MSGLVLHGYWRSSASYRVRIALNLKQLNYAQVTHDLRRGEQTDPAYRTLAPAGLVPALEFEGRTFVQSMAIMEWLDERWPAPPLLPTGPDARAIVRGMTATLAADTHPLNNLRVIKYLKNDLQQAQQVCDTWMAHWIEEGFSALEVMVAQHGGAYAFGDQPTMADCCIVPQVYNAERFRVDLSRFPRLCAVTSYARVHAAFAAAHPDLQPDADPA